MINREIHIVTFDLPYPPTYGGAIEMYYKIKSLAEIGVKIHLHTFLYHRKPNEDLNKYCVSVNYYPRNISKSLLIHKLPYIVISRKNSDLLHNLIQDDFPILFEGLHTTGWLDQLSVYNKITMVRCHNIEHEYYEELSKSEKNLFKKLYFKQESVKLKNWESVLIHAKSIAAITKNDLTHFTTKNQNSFYLPAFHPFKHVSSLEGKGDYALYHGNLSVSENSNAAKNLIREVFSTLPYKFIIAGNKPDNELKFLASQYSNITLITNPDSLRMQELISNAQFNILISDQATGIKLKLLYSLFSGRFCIVNKNMVEHTGLDDLCIVANSNDKIKDIIETYLNKSFTNTEIELRKIKLSEWDTLKNAELIMKYLH